MRKKRENKGKIIEERKTHPPETQNKRNAHWTKRINDNDKGEEYAPSNNSLNENKQ